MVCGYSNTAIVFIIFLLLYIRFSLFLISSKNPIITTLFVSVLLPRMFEESEVIDYPCTLKHITCFRNQNHQDKCTSSYRHCTNYNIRPCFTIFHSSSDGIPNSIYSAATLTKPELRLNAISFGLFPCVTFQIQNPITTSTDILKKVTPLK